VLIEPRTVLFAAALFVGIGLCWVVISRATDVLILLFLAIILAEGLRPIVGRLHALAMPRPVGVLLIYAVVLVILGLLGWLLLQPVLTEAETLAENLPTYVADIQHHIAHIQRTIRHQSEVGNALGTLQGQVASVARSLAFLLLHLPFTMADIVIKFLAVLFMAFFWLTATGGLKPFAVGLLPPQLRDEASAILGEMGYRLGGYLRGTLVNMVAVGIATAIAMKLLGVPYPILLGIVSGLTEMLPLLGTFIGQGTAIVVALITMGPLTAGEVWFVTMLIQQAEANILVPVVMHRAVDLNPLSVTIAILMGASLFGVLGAIIAVPLGVVVKILIVRVLAPAARSLWQSAHPVLTPGDTARGAPSAQSRTR
jgi:predicted PurR-regulated permease PerM